MITYSCIEETKAYWYAWNVVEGNIIASEDVINSCRDLLMILKGQRMKIILIILTLILWRELKMWHHVLSSQVEQGQDRRLI